MENLQKGKNGKQTASLFERKKSFAMDRKKKVKKEGQTKATATISKGGEAPGKETDLG